MNGYEFPTYKKTPPGWAAFLSLSEGFNFLFKPPLFLYNPVDRS